MALGATTAHRVAALGPVHHAEAGRLRRSRVKDIVVALTYAV